MDLSLYTFWINCDHSTDRCNFMTTFLKNNNILNRRVSAVTPATLYPYAYKDEIHTGHVPTPLEFACLFSHFKCMDLARKEGLKEIIVMEDDILPIYKIDFKELLKTAPVDWEILQLFNINATKISENFNKYRENRSIWSQWDYRDWSTGCYIVNKKGIDRLLGRFLKNDNSFDFTGMRCNLVADEVLYVHAKTYTINIPLYINRVEFGSIIHPDHMSNHLRAYQEIEKVKNIVKEEPDLTKQTFINRIL